ncbi:MAG: hypothetical protein FJZ00_05130 [Candidatus Sericytochromatia bacterium]|uniref:Uncharacterized protein n=1 Tax=Candidatus Tanganyikabacteria bacterium TaxID=2961651 RepID=A0A937X1Y3_9BACT|nr:hypothetical protein [Candidatus Tanganyikabacteria bacterium]
MKLRFKSASIALATTLTVFSLAGCPDLLKLLGPSPSPSPSPSPTKAATLPGGNAYQVAP